ncbi:unnamed protein product [Brassicogethes aeneus]|uniref:THAP-type domain-containing protein n=1 Tax=Brassicogethes aeneus TaxID=1431903 RepID=A0A9P0AWU8_BRAAE|nr:unnamed protein product [Brassicogethes aeneus]
MGKCVVTVCPSRSETSSILNKPISFFHFPKNPVRKAQWVKTINRDPQWIPATGSRICSLHFDEKYVILNTRGYRHLSPDAIPTINLTKQMFHDKSTQTTEVISPSPFIVVGSSLPTTSQSFDEKNSLFSPGKDVIFTIGDLDTPREKKLKFEIKRLNFICEKRRKIVKKTQEKNRRLTKKVDNLTSLLNDLKNKSLLDSDKNIIKLF